jgi:hypothetical protein
MKRTIVAMGACVCLAAIISIAMAQTPPITTAPAPAQPPVPEPVASATMPLPVAPSYMLDQPINQLLGKWKAAKDDAEREHLKKQVRELLKVQFTARLAGHEKEIEQLEAKVKELREQLSLRREKEDEIVDFRFQQLLREAQGLGWGTEPGTGDTEKTGGPVSSGYGIATGSGGMGAFQLQQRSMNSSATGGRGGSFSWSASQSGGRRSGTSTTDDSSTARPVAPTKSAPFEGFFRRFDANGNGMLEEDEVKDTSAKSVIEAVYEQQGKQVTYPIAISDILKVIDGFHGRIRVRESSGGEDGSRNLDVDIEPIGTETANHETKVFSLGNGNAYTLIFTRSTEGDRLSHDSRAIPVEVKNEDGKITISRFGGAKLVFGELRGNDFSGTMNESGGPVKLEGKLTANDTASGDVTGGDKDGKKTVVGTFTLAPTVLTPTLGPRVDSAKVFSLESGKYTLTLARTTEGGKYSGDSRTFPVDVKNEDGKIAISRADGGKLVVGELRNNEFSGTMNESGGPVRLQGKLTANHEANGDVTSEGKNGQKAVVGTFCLSKFNQD